MDDNHIETLAAKVVLDIGREAEFKIPALPDAETWRTLAILRLRRRVSPHNHFTRSEEAFYSTLETLSVHPVFKQAAEAALLKAEREFREIELDALEAAYKRIDPSEWGLSESEMKHAKVIGGLVAPKTGPGIPNWDSQRERAAFELQVGVLALNGFLQDLRRALDLKTKIQNLKAEMADMLTSDEREARARAAALKAAKQERSQLKKRTAVEPEPVAA